MELTPTLVSLALVTATVVGALPPVARRWGHGGLHLFIAASAGIFLGTVFLHLLPELAAAAQAEAGHDHGDHAHHGGSLPWFAALFGFLGLFLLEKVWLRASAGRKPDPHAIVWLSTYIGLGVHAFTAGLGLSAVPLESLVLVPLLWHKVTESFSLTSVLQLSGARAGRIALLVGSFALATPLGYLAGEELLSRGGEISASLLGLACGTFLYVAACDLLPEVFHQLERRTPRLVALVAGIASTALVPHELEDSWRESLPVELALGSWDVFLAMAPYLVLGFLAAGLLSQWLSTRRLARGLAHENLRSVALASVVGAPLPLCSCSVLPVAAALRRAGASKGATSAFLVATPETGVDSVSVTLGLFDPLMAVVRPIASVLSALLTGLGVSLFARSGADDEPRAGLAAEADPASGGADDAPSCCGDAAVDSSDDAAASCCGDDAAASCCDDAPPQRTRGFLARVLHYAFVEMFDDLAGALAVGLVLSGLITALVPEEALTGGLLSGGAGLVAMLVVGIPVYVCAASSTPIAAALVLKGLSPGAALVFLLAGPATNLATLVVMARTLGKRGVLVHLGVLAAVTLALGFALDGLYAALELAPSARLGHPPAEAERWLQLTCAGLLLALFGASLARRWRRGAAHGHAH
ncbi:MAG: SO_0444 family Cu/Zn efflux transporter [Planctomycetes bacterium]|nr:SO_0444 family Cu/Zn efflux transporter [Planctomycetota bacterium]